MTYQAIVALLRHLAGDAVADTFPEITPLGDDWLRDMKRIHLANLEESERTKTPLHAYLP